MPPFLLSYPVGHKVPLEIMDKLCHSEKCEIYTKCQRNFFENGPKKAKREVKKIDLIKSCVTVLPWHCFVLVLALLVLLDRESR